MIKKIFSGDLHKKTPHDPWRFLKVHMADFGFIYYLLLFYSSLLFIPATNTHNAM